MLLISSVTVAGLSLANSASGQDDRVLYLTFDDGPSNDFTWSILDALDDHGAKATFFPLGSKLNSAADLMRSMVDRGHQVGNHTMSHPNLPDLSDDEVWREFNDASNTIEGVIGAKPTCMRPPSGSSNARVDGIAESLGMTKVLWNRGGNDYGLKSGDEFLDRVRNAQSGDIILLHDPAGPATVEATRRVLEHFTAQGFRFETVPQCRSIVPVEPSTTTSTTTTTTTTTTRPPTTTTTTRPPPTTVPPTTVPLPDAPMVIRAQGTTGTEIIKIKVNRKVVAGFQLTTEMRDFRYIPRKSMRANNVTVIFVNDGDHKGVDRDVTVDFIAVNGRVFETEAPNVKSKGVWSASNGCGKGLKESEQLSCKGWFRYPMPKRTKIAPN